MSATMASPPDAGTEAETRMTQPPRAKDKRDGPPGWVVALSLCVIITGVVLALIWPAGPPWLKRAAQTYTVAGVEVTLLGAKLQRWDPFDKHLEVRLKITNKTAKQITWRKGYRRKDLVDEHGNMYETKSSSSDTYINPGETAEVFVRYGLPIPEAKHFSLTLGLEEHLGLPGQQVVFNFDRPPDEPPPWAPPLR